jgi:hypothetical protein
MSRLAPPSTVIRAGVLLILSIWSMSSSATGQTTNQFPGGWVEKQGTATRWKYTDAQVQAFVPPTRGPFTFPAPYNTKAVRITDASDCGGADCVAYVGYSYWSNTNAHTGSNDMWIFLSLDSRKGGSGPTLFRLNKSTDAVTKVGPLFPAGSQFVTNTGEGWYFSASRPNKLYLNDGPRMLRYDVISKVFDTVFDVTAQFGTNRYIWQLHSSSDDMVHSATLRVSGTNQDLGCVVYNENTQRFTWFARTGVYNECHIDKSGRYLLIMEELDGVVSLENIFIDLQTGARFTVLGQNNAVGHHDMGYGYVLGGDAWNPLPNAVITFSFTPTFVTKGPTVFRSIGWNVAAINHITHSNARPGVPMSQQFACGSNADSSSIQNEIICFRLDTSGDQLIVAPVMTNLNAAGGCCGGTYAKMPKGNLDITGRYFIWTANLGSNRLDAFLVKVPSQLLVAAAGDTNPPNAPQNLRIE